MNFEKETTQYEGVPMSEVLAELFEDKDRIVERPREYLIEGKLQSNELEQLSKLPFEVSVRSQGNRLVLATGSEFASRPVNYLLEHGLPYDQTISAFHGSQFNESKIDFHSHPAKDVRAATASFPSPGDFRSQLMGYAWSKEEEVVNPMLIGTLDSLVTIIGRSDKDMRVARENLNEVVSLSEAQIRRVLEESGEGGEEELVQILKNLTEAMKEYFEIDFIPWNEAQGEIDTCINFVKN